MTRAPSIRIVPAGGEVPLDLLDGLAADLARVFGVSCHVEAGALDPERAQYFSTILCDLARRWPAEQERLLAVTALDLNIPVLTFVFGEAQLDGRAVLVSLHRLREEFYGLPARDDLFRERLLKEAVHELGHTFGLRHCDHWRCVMASSHLVERIDVKGVEFCAACRRPVEWE